MWVTDGHSHAESRRSLKNRSKRDFMNRLTGRVGRTLLAPLFMLALTGCQSTNPPGFSERGPQTGVKSDEMVFSEGDSLRIHFPGAPNLDPAAPLQIRRDGRVTLPIIGEFRAAGLTPSQMEKELVKLYKPHLQTPDVTVSVEASALNVYVTGAVLRPGKVMSDHPITALEAIMEAGGFDYTKANLKGVRVIRNENGQTQHYTLNLKHVLQGRESDQFKLKPGDIVYVPERFSWF